MKKILFISILLILLTFQANGSNIDFSNPITSGLQRAYLFEEGFGNTITDSVSGNSSTLNNNPNWTTSVVSEKNVVQFQKIFNQSASITDDPIFNFDPSQSYTWNFIVRPENLPDVARWDCLWAQLIDDQTYLTFYI